VAASALLTATGRPGADPAVLAEVAAALPRLPGTPVSTDGRILEFDADWPEGEAPHRHISHLFDLCPGEAITVDATPELAVAASRALDYRGDEGVGWSLAWKARCWARLHDAERSMALLHNLFSPVPSTVLEWADEGGGTYPNLLMCCPPFMIDANLGYTAALLELFVQDHAGLIDLLPACPTDLDRGDLDGLRLRGGLILDLSWSDGRVTRARLASPVAQERRIRVNGTVHEVALAAGDTDLSTIL
jgi:alpha-L-fucosidase 2